MDLGSLLTAAILQSCCEMGGSAITSNFKVMGLLDIHVKHLKSWMCKRNVAATKALAGFL